MSTFTGLYVERLGTGVISDVHVLDAAGNKNSLDPDVYIQSGIQPPIEQLPDMEEYSRTNVTISKKRTPASIFGWVTLAAIIVTLMTTVFSVHNDCSGVAYDSEKCLWARSLFLVTAGMFFIVVWPICFFAGLIFFSDRKI